MGTAVRKVDQLRLAGEQNKPEFTSGSGSQYPTAEFPLRVVALASFLPSDVVLVPFLTRSILANIPERAFWEIQLPVLAKLIKVIQAHSLVSLFYNFDFLIYNC